MAIVGPSKLPTVTQDPNHAMSHRIMLKDLTLLTLLNPI